MNEFYPVEDYFVYPPDNKTVKIYFENGSSIETISTDRPSHYVNRAEQAYADWIETKLKIASSESSMFDFKGYIQEDMKVLFIRSEDYNDTVDWYESLSVVKMHRKTCVICSSPQQFMEQFDRLKFGWNYTIFYFDDRMKPAELLPYFEMLVRCYGEEEGREVLSSRIRKLNLNLTKIYEQFSSFEDFQLDPNLLNVIIKKAHRPCYCRSLL